MYRYFLLSLIFENIFNMALLIKALVSKLDLFLLLYLRKYVICDCFTLESWAVRVPPPFTVVQMHLSLHFCPKTPLLLATVLF